MKTVFVFVVLVSMAGCKFIAPNVSKAMSEEAQIEEMKKQTAAMEKISFSLQWIATSSMCRDCKKAYGIIEFLAEIEPLGKRIHVDEYRLSTKSRY